MYFKYGKKSAIVKSSKGRHHWREKNRKGKGGLHYVKDQNVPERVLQDMRTQMTKRNETEND